MNVHNLKKMNLKKYNIKKCCIIFYFVYEESTNFKNLLFIICCLWGSLFKLQNILDDKLKLIKGICVAQKIVFEESLFCIMAFPKAFYAELMHKLCL